MNSCCFPGPGEAGKSTLIKQMQLIHGESMEQQERVEKIPYIRQNVFDSMVVSIHSSVMWLIIGRQRKVPAQDGVILGTL